MAGKFEIYKDKAGEFRFRLKATNGQVIATGEGYKTKASAINGIESVQKNAPGAKVEDLTQLASAYAPLGVCRCDHVAGRDRFVVVQTW